MEHFEAIPSRQKTKQTPPYSDQDLTGIYWVDIRIADELMTHRIFLPRQRFGLVSSSHHSVRLLEDSVSAS